MQSKCGSCGQSRFEVVNASAGSFPRLRGTSHAYNFVQCAACGTVVGVIEAVNAGKWLFEIMRKLGLNANEANHAQAG